MEGNYVSRDKHREESLSFEEHTWGSSWPARNYGCSFCKREFRSAQALGGHMNVHRRDRARLRSGTPLWLHSESPKPNPTITNPPPPTPNPPLLSLNYPPHRSSLTFSASSSPSLASTGEDGKPLMLITSSSNLPLLTPQSTEIKINYDNSRIDFGSRNEELQDCAKEERLKGFKQKEDNNSNNNNNITLELGLGLLQHPKEQIDLELRLGHL